MEGKNYILLLYRLGLLLLVYTICRMIFYLFNMDYFAEATGGQLSYAFLLGLRFDLTAIFAINSLYIIASLLPFNFQKRAGYNLFLKILYLALNLPLLYLNIIDSEYFKYTGKRTTFDVLLFYSDIQDQAGQLFFSYWYISLLVLIAGLILWRFYPEKTSLTKVKINKLSGVFLLLLTLGINFLFIRGSFGKRPITPKNAFELSPSKLGHLVLNTPFSFLYTIQAKGVEGKRYFSDSEELLPLLNKKPDISGKASKENVVLIILESFSKEYMGYGHDYQGYTPFLDSLSGEGLFFPYHFANGRRSIEALPAILAGIPHLSDVPYINSIYQNNFLSGIGNNLKKAGYHTSFFHGGRNGTFGFDSFSGIAGFDHYYGQNEYPNLERDFDGKWGVFDEPYLQYFANKLSNFPQPFLSSVFTLSSHPPYPIPEKYKGKFPKGELEIHESIGYSDYSLKQFFKQASKQPWYKNTLFIITADHTHFTSKQKYANEIGNYYTPLLFFHPGKEIEADTNQITQQCDLMPTILDYLNVSPAYYNLFGRSLFDPHEGGFAVNQTNNTYRYIGKDYMLSFREDGESTLFQNYLFPDSSRIGKDQNKIKVEYERKLKAFIQYYNNGLRSNKLFLDYETVPANGGKSFIKR